MSGSRPSRESDTLRLAMLVARRDYLRTVRRRGYVFGTLLLPVGIAALMAISTFFSVRSVDVAGGGGGTLVVVNESDIAIPDMPGDGVDIRLAQAQEAAADLASGRIATYYVIPGDLRSGGTVTRIEADVGAGLARMGAMGDQEQSLRTAIRVALLREAGVAPDVARQILQGVTIVAVTPDGGEVSGLDIAAGIALPMVFVGLFMVSIFITSGYLLQSVTEEKENRVVEIVLSSIPPLPLMGGKIVGLGGAGLTQVAIWAITALIALPLLASQVGDLSAIGLDPTIIVLALVYFVLGYLAFGAIFAAIGAMAPGNREAQQYSGFLGFFAAIPFILFTGFLTDLESTMVVALSLFPLTAPTSMLIVLGLSEQIPWPLVGASLVSLALFGLAATWASARIFRATVLLYGVRPSLGQLIAAVRSPR